MIPIELRKGKRTELRGQRGDSVLHPRAGRGIPKPVRRVHAELETQFLELDPVSLARHRMDELVDQNAEALDRIELVDANDDLDRSVRRRAGRPGLACGPPGALALRGEADVEPHLFRQCCIAHSEIRAQLGRRRPEPCPGDLVFVSDGLADDRPPVQTGLPDCPEMPYDLRQIGGLNGHRMVTEFDALQRGLIRRKLIAYMKQHGIGVTRLAERIKAAHPRRPQIPVKSLGRFLDGRMRTEDRLVSFCAHFTEKMPDPDPMVGLGLALSAVFKPPSGLSGSFVPEDEGSPITEKSTFFIEDGGEFVRITEHLPREKVTYRGVAVQCESYPGLCGDFFTAVLSDALFNLPRTLTLNYAFPSLMGGGSGIDAITGLCKTFRIHVIRSEKDELDV